MSLKLNLAIRPVGAAAAALTQAHNEHQAANTAAGAKKMRRTKSEFSIPGTGAVMEIIRTEANSKIKGATAVYGCTASPVDYLVGKDSFSSASHVYKATQVQLALFKASLKAQFPNLPDSVLRAITEDHCSLESLALLFYFEYENETEAYRAFQDWLEHLKVVFDGADRLPTRSTVWKKSPPRVNSDPGCRNAFIVALPFGQARISLKRDLDAYPATFGDKNSVSVEERKGLLAKTRCLLCIEIDVDLRKFYYTDSNGLDLQLPSDFRLWQAQKMAEDPVKIIWDQFRRETWLNADLAVNEAEIDLSRLPWQLQEIAKAYLAGENIKRHEHIGNDPKKFVKYREALIAKAHIDILNPWAINKLNLGKVLGPDFTFEARFQPQKCPEFEQHTLSGKRINGAILKLDAAMQGKPGWMFDASAFEKKSEKAAS